MHLLPTLLLLALIAVLGLWPGLRKYRNVFGIEHLLATGHGYLLIGLILGPAGLDLIDHGVLVDIAPVTAFLLAWVGLIVGLRLDPRLLRRVGSLGLSVTLLEGLLPMVLVPLALFGLLRGQSEGAGSVGGLLLVSGVAAGTAATTATYLLRSRRDHELTLVQICASLDDWLMLPLVGLAFLWMAEGGAWGVLGMSVLGAVAVGAVLLLLAPLLHIPGEELVVIVGAAGLCGGLATYLGSSAVISGAIAGLLLAAFGRTEGARQIYLLTTRVERPFFHLLMLILGALLPADLFVTWAGWGSIALALVVGRGLAKGVAGFGIAQLSRGALGHRRSAVALLPMSPLAVVLAADFHLRVASAQSSALLAGVAAAWLSFELITAALVPLMLRWTRAR